MVLWRVNNKRIHTKRNKMKAIMYIISAILLLPAGGYLVSKTVGKSLGHQGETMQINGVLSFIWYFIVGLLKIIITLVGALFGWIYVAVFGQHNQPAMTMVVIGVITLFIALAINNEHKAHH